MPVSNQLPGLFRLLRHIIGVLLAALITLGLTGCSAVKLSYQNAPELIYWWLDSYLDINDTQARPLRAELQALQAWHRQQELPFYLGALEQMQRMAPSAASPAQVCSLIDGLRPRLQALLDRVEPGTSTLVPTLTAAQLAHLSRQFDKRSQKWREQWLSGTPEERQASRLKRLIERAESFYGRLEDVQVSVLRASVSGSAFDANLSYRESQRRYQDTLQTLRQLQGAGLTGTEVRTQVHALLARSLRSPEADYRNYLQGLDQENCETLAALHNSTSAPQRRQLAETLKDYASDVRALMNPQR